MAVRILTDSAADFETQELRERDILRIPLEVRFGDDTYLDGETIHKEEFYRLLTSRPDSPSTSQPSPEAFLGKYEEAQKAGDSLVVIVISSTLSGTYQSACLAKELCGYGDIHIVDSHTASAGEHLLVDLAWKMAREGMSAAQIAAELEALKSRVRIFAVVDTLEYLCRGGRLSRTEAQLGTLVHVKPILTLAATDGVIRAREKALGLSRARGRLLKLLEQAPFDDRYPMYPLYSHTMDNCEKLCQEFRAQYPEAELAQPVGMGPTIGTHVGPGALGFVYVEK